MLSYTIHVQRERNERFERIDRELGADYVDLAEIIIDRGHKDGPEIHVIDSRAVITIYNLYTGKLITKLIARPGQISRYYKDSTIKPLWYEAIMNLAQYNYKKGRNLW